MDSDYYEETIEESTMERMTAPLLRRLVKEDNTPNGYYLAEKKDKELFEQVEKTIRELPPNDERLDFRRIWISIPRGPIEDFGDYNEEDWGSYEEFADYWKYKHPDETDWYVFFYEKMPDGKRYLGVDNLVIFADDRDSLFRSRSYYHTSLLKWLIGAVREQVDSVIAGTYHNRVINELPIGYRKGVVKRSDVWESGYWTRERDLDGTTEEDIEKFTKLVENGIEKEPKGRLPSMTLNYYLETCSLCFNIFGKDVSGMTLEEQYRRFADGRDDGMLKIDPDDAEAFKVFCKNSQSGHIWEIRPGHGFSRMHLYPVDDEKGWYFALNGCFDRTNFIHIALEFSARGIPLEVYDAEKVAIALKGDDYIGIVPRGDYPFYASSRFDRHNVMDCISFDDEMYELLKDKIEWYDVNTFYGSEHPLK